MSYEQLLKGHPAEDIARLCFSKLRFLPAALKAQLRQQGLWEDLAQELYRISLEGWIRGMSPKEVGGIASGEIRAFLKAYGYRRCKANHHEFFSKPETSLADISEIHLRGAIPITSADCEPTGLEEAVLALLRKHPDGLSQCQVNRAIGRRTAAAVVSGQCTRLVVRGVVKEVPRSRSNGNGRPPGPILVLTEATTRKLVAAGR